MRGRPKARRTSLYCTVISTGPLVIARMPEAFVPWSEIRTALHAAMRDRHGVLARDIHAIEGLAGDPQGDADDGQAMGLCSAAFDGDLRVLSAFSLLGWEERSRSFQTIRDAIRRENA